MKRPSPSSSWLQLGTATAFFPIIFCVATTTVSVLARAAAGAQPPSAFNVKQYGATGNGVIPDQNSINKTIEACAAAGGGTVYFPAGNYLTGTIVLKNNVTLWLDAGATLLGSKNLADYQTVKHWIIGGAPGPLEGGALILAMGVHNVAILGSGVIDGQRVFDPKGLEHMRGPHAALFMECKDITVRDVSFRDAANYALALRACEHVNVNGIVVRGGWDAINMFDTKNVTISNCRFFTGDDCLAGQYWENVTVSDCIFNTSCNALRVGGRNVLINHCLMYGPGEFEHRTGHRHNLEAGFQILPHRELVGVSNKVVTPAPVDNMVLSDITMINVRSPIFVAFSADAAASKSNLGVGRIIVDNLTVVDSGRAPIYVSAPPENPMKSMILRNVRMTVAGGVEEQHSLGQAFTGPNMLPSYGLYCRNVDNVELHDVRVNYRDKDRRPAVMGENIGTLEFDRFVAQREPDGSPSLLFAGIRKLLLDGREAGIAKLRVQGLDVQPAEVFVNEPFLASVRVENPGAEGLGEVPLRLGEQTVTRNVWLKAGETTHVRFINLRSNEAGTLAVQSGNFARELTVRPKPSGHDVGAPFLAFQNTQGQVRQIDGGFYIQAVADRAVLDYADQYGAAYQRHALARHGSVVTKVENADSRAGWGGRAGIMVRNDISKPGQAAGYLVLGASPSNGYSLEWDSNGDGRIDRHTEFDGYTYWPHWLKLERQGSKFTGYYSLDGSDWNKVGEAQVPSAEERVDVGVFTHRNSARFTHWKVSKVAKP